MIHMFYIIYFEYNHILFIFGYNHSNIVFINLKIRLSAFIDSTNIEIGFLNDDFLTKL